MGIRIGQREFSPSVFMSLLTAFCFGLFCMLGNWQLQRAELKRDIQGRFEEQLELPYEYIVLSSELNEALIYRKIRLQGAYQAEKVILLDNQVHQGVAGYHVLMPFFIDGGAKAVLVDRGWVAAGDDRAVLPSIKAPKNAQWVKGIVTIPVIEGYRLGQVEMSGQWPQRIPYLDLSKIQQGLSFELLPYVIWQAPEMDDYYIRDWKPIWSSPEKSEAYALQWFSFAAVVLLLFVILNFKKVSAGEPNE